MTSHEGDEGHEWDVMPQPTTGRWRRLLTILAVVGVVGLLGAGGCVLWLQRQIDPPGSAGAAVTVEIPRGSSTQRIAAVLDDKGVIKSARIFRLYARFKGAGDFQAGTYTFRRNQAFDDVIDLLERGPKLVFDRFTVPEGLTLRQIAERVGRLPGRSAQRFLEVAASGSVRSQFQPEGTTNLEGLLFPDTYNLAPTDDEAAIVTRMVAAFDIAAAQSGIEKVGEGGLVNPYEAVIVASLVEREARVAEDRGMVARVIYNRLQRGMPLQVDATVIYALGRTGERGLRVLNRDLEVQSPYNTYKIRGLPPTPIAAPGRAALRAAVDPTAGPWLFYVVVEANGRHAFATTLAEHNRNIALAESRGVR